MKIEELFDVSGKSVVITGGASGIGLAIAEAFLANGSKVAIVDLNEAALVEQLPRLQAMGPALALQADISDRKSIDGAVAKVADAHGGVDVVFANAGTEAGSGFLSMTGQRVASGAVENVEERNWDRVLNVNLKGALITAQAAIPLMKAKGGGRIIVTSSIAAQVASAVASVGYCASKAAVSHLVRRLALELAKFNILVNEISPGGVLTNINNGMWRDDAVVKATEMAVPLHRVARPEDLQGIALYLASPASSYVTGSKFVVDGGMTLGMAD